MTTTLSAEQEKKQKSADSKMEELWDWISSEIGFDEKGMEIQDGIREFCSQSNARIRLQTLQEVQGLIEEVASDPPLESNERRRGFQEFAAKLSALIKEQEK